MSKNTNLSFLTDYITADITNGRIGINNASPAVAFDVVGATKITGVLTLTSTISNGTYAYTLPSATGTLALTSSLSSYVPYTGASASVDLGTFDLTGRYLVSAGASALGGVVSMRQDAAYIPKGDGYSSIASSFVLFDFRGYTGASTYKNFALRFDGLTNNTQRTYTLPDASGTLALTSDLSGYLPLTGGTLTGALGGTSATFSGQVIGVGLRSNSSAYMLYMSPPTGDAIVLYDDSANTRYGFFNETDSRLDLMFSKVNGAATFSSDLTTGGKILISDGGNATIPCLKIGSATTGISQNVSEQMHLITNSTTKMVITSAGNVGIGESNPGNLLVIKGASPRFTIDTDGTTNTIGGIYFRDGGIGASSRASISTAGQPLTFGANGANVEQMRITSAGFVGIGLTNPQYLLHIPTGNNLYLSNLFIAGTNANPILSSGATGGSFFIQGGGAGEGKIYLQGAASGGNGYIEFSAGGSLRMTIASNGNIGAPSGSNIYNASDARLKKNISTTTYGLNTISALNPVKFNWVDGFEPTEDSKDMLGFIAQEVQAVLPEAVESFGGNSITIGNTVIDNPLRVNEKFIIPVLVKAIQELKAEIETLKNK
jgi:hypothetical protein